MCVCVNGIVCEQMIHLKYPFDTNWQLHDWKNIFMQTRAKAKIALVGDCISASQRPLDICHNL